MIFFMTSKKTQGKQFIPLQNQALITNQVEDLQGLPQKRARITKHAIFCRKQGHVTGSCEKNCFERQRKLKTQDSGQIFGMVDVAEAEHEGNSAQKGKYEEEKLG